VDGNAFLLGAEAQRVGTRSRLLRGAEYRSDIIAAGEKRIEDGFAEILLTDDRNPHVDILMW
jgi:hypothetical protein